MYSLKTFVLPFAHVYDFLQTYPLIFSLVYLIMTG